MLATLATPAAPIWRFDNLFIDMTWFGSQTFYMKRILIAMTMLATQVMADDKEMADFVGGVYRHGKVAVVLDGETALVDGRIILRDGDVFITPKGAYSNDKGTYSGPDGIVVKDCDAFTGKTGAIIGSECFYFGGGQQKIVLTGTRVNIRKP